MAKKMAKFSQKMLTNANDWECHFCNKNFKHQSSLCKHIKKKHPNEKWLNLAKNANKMLTNANISIVEKWYICDHCGKKYKHAASLSRHKRSCKDQVLNMEKNVPGVQKNVPLEEKNVPLVQKIVNNTINNKININFYLHENCKNALNLKDFVEQITLNLNDVINTKQLGYSGGVSEILIKNLENIPQSERPVQCTEIQPLEYYVKDDNKWSKNVKIDMAIGKITKKQAEQLREWTKNNPGWNKTEGGIKEWRDLQKNIMGSSTEEVMIKNKNEILEKICKSSKVKI
jgi:hypothetical protein